MEEDRLTVNSHAAPRLVRDLMTVGVKTCTPSTPINEVARLLIENNLEDLIVLEEGKAIGVIGREDLARFFAHHNLRETPQSKFDEITASEVMREGVPQIPPDIPLTAAAQIMLDLKVRTLFLMHHASGIEYPAAYLSYWHILRYLAAESLDELRDLGIKAQRFSPLESFAKKRDLARSKNVKVGIESISTDSKAISKKGV
jgi:CBS domain-containing protein